MQNMTPKNRHDHIVECILKAYAFDFDKNIGFTTTRILLEYYQKEIMEIIDVSQQEHYDLEAKHLIGPDKDLRFIDNEPEQSFIGFREEGDFIKQSKHIVDHKAYGPSWKKFVQAHTIAGIISIITARGQSVEEIKEGHKILIYNALQQKEIDQLITRMKIHLGENGRQLNDDEIIQAYLDNNYYAPCSNPAYLQTINSSLKDPMWLRKTRGFELFIQHVMKIYDFYHGKDFMADKQIEVGFSDDVKKTIDGMQKFISTIHHRYPHVDFSLFDTENPAHIKKIFLPGKGRTDELRHE